MDLPTYMVSTIPTSLFSTYDTYHMTDSNKNNSREEKDGDNNEELATN